MPPSQAGTSNTRAGTARNAPHTQQQTACHVFLKAGCVRISS